MLHTEDGQVIEFIGKRFALVLPEVDNYKPPEQVSRLWRMSTEWLNVTLPDGRKAKRETNTMPQWAGSCWYYLRYLDPKNEKCGWDQAKEKYWMNC